MKKIFYNEDTVLFTVSFNSENLANLRDFLNKEKNNIKDKYLLTYIDTFIKEFFETYKVLGLYKNIFPIKSIGIKLYISHEILDTECWDILISSFIDYSNDYLDLEEDAVNLDNIDKVTYSNIEHAVTIIVKSFILTMKNFWLIIRDNKNLCLNTAYNKENYFIIQELNGGNTFGYLIHESN